MSDADLPRPYVADKPARVPSSDEYDRERSIEHGILPPVYGTVAPLHGLSGAVRRAAYARYSEARLAHWLLLIAGDRIETLGANLRSLASLHPDDPITETGVLTEGLTEGDGLRQRLAANRADRSHQWIDPILVAGPWVVGGWLGYRVLKRVLHRG